jgi:hypothetical protein
VARRANLKKESRIGAALYALSYKERVAGMRKNTTNPAANNPTTASPNNIIPRGGCGVKFSTAIIIFDSWDYKGNLCPCNCFTMKNLLWGNVNR